MSQVSIIIPGMLLPQETVNSLSEQAISTIVSMTRPPGGEPAAEIVTAGPESGSVHLAIAWRALTRRPLPYERAPFTWLADDGPMFFNETWRLRLCRRDSSGRLLPLSSPVTGETAEAAASTLSGPLRREGFTIQRSGTAIYVTRRRNWGVVTRDWRTMAGRTPSLETDICPSAFFSGKQEDKETARDVLSFILRLTDRLAATGIRNEGEAVDALWIDGGGRPRDFNPPTRIRAVLSDDRAVLGWAACSGILCHRTGPADGAVSWPAGTPPGERLAVLEEVYDPWLHQDWLEWGNRLPRLSEQVSALIESGRAGGCTKAVIAACGRRAAVFFTVGISRTAPLFSRFTGRKVPSPAQWMPEPEYPD